MIRLFVALRPPRSVRDALAAAMGGVPQARWQDDEQLHLTLRFIGEVDRHQAEDVAAALAGVYAPAPRLAVAGVGAFDHRGRVDTLWAGVTPHDALAHLHRKVDRACVSAGLPADKRAYRPHITLARLPRSAGGGIEVQRWLGDHAGLATAAFVVAHLVLYESQLTPAGARYAAVARWPLATFAGDPGS